MTDNRDPQIIGEILLEVKKKNPDLTLSQIYDFFVLGKFNSKGELKREMVGQETERTRGAIRQSQSITDALQERYSGIQRVSGFPSFEGPT